MRNKQTSRRHLLSQMSGGLWVPQNILRIDHNLHVAFHRVFGHDTIVDQYRNLTAFNESSLSKQIVQEINDILNKYQGIMELEAYNPNCIDVDKFLEFKKLTNNRHYEP